MQRAEKLQLTYDYRSLLATNRRSNATGSTCVEEYIAYMLMFPLTAILASKHFGPWCRFILGTCGSCKPKIVLLVQITFDRSTLPAVYRG